MHKFNIWNIEKVVQPNLPWAQFCTDMPLHVRRTVSANYEIGLLLNLSETMIILNYVFQHIPTPTVMGVRRNFSRGRQRRHFAYLFQFVSDATQMDVQKNVQCYGNSYIQCLSYKNISHWKNVCFSENGYINTEL